MVVAQVVQVRIRVQVQTSTRSQTGLYRGVVRVPQGLLRRSSPLSTSTSTDAFYIFFFPAVPRNARVNVTVGTRAVVVAALWSEEDWQNGREQV